MKVFIGSSSSREALQVMEDVAVQLEQISAVNISALCWNDTKVFVGGFSTIENLEAVTKQVDAALFVYAEDDILLGKPFVGTPRDNVVFETGLFAGSLGSIHKSVIIRYKKPKILTDLSGIDYIEYDKDKTNLFKKKLEEWIKKIEPYCKSVDTEKAKPQLCEFHVERENIKQKLDKLKTSGLLEVFDNQIKAMEDYTNTGTKSESPIRILCIRGDSFVTDKPGNWSTLFNGKSPIIAIFSSASNSDLIKSRFDSCHKDNETEERFVKRYAREMKSAQETIKDDDKNLLYLHMEDDFSYRMLFIDDILYMSTFQKDKKASELKVIKIQKKSDLYSICEDYFNKIKDNAVKQLTN
jgi:hypothetical protein